MKKSYFDVLGICCPSEVPVVESILKALEGVQKISVIVPSRTVIVVHDEQRITAEQIAKALNQAGLEASVRAYGTQKMITKCPSPFAIAAGVLLLVSFFQRFWHPLKWFALAAAVIGLPPILQRGYAAVCRCTIDINTLMIITVAGSIALGDYSEAGIIVFLFTMAEWLETMASHKASDGMTSLMSAIPQTAVLAGTGEEISALAIKIGTLIAVKAGQLIPIDGIVVEGQSEVNESSLTGESYPVPKQGGSQVFAGTLNIDGYITVQTTALAENSTVAKMVKLVEEAQNKWSSMQRLIDTVAKYYTPVIIIMALGVAVIPAAIKVHNMKYWWKLALVVLVSACPCALVLSTPIASFSALNVAAKSGLLIKGGDILEALAKIRVVAFDKTGTITRGDFCVRGLHIVGSNITVQKLLYWVSSIESKSSHPMASALVEHARVNFIEPQPDNVKDFHIYPGEGICGDIDGMKIYVGNRKILLRASCSAVPENQDTEAATLAYVVCNQELCAILMLSDSCRTGSKEALLELRSLGIKRVMLTGDRSEAAQQVQGQLGNIFEEIHAELLPEDKVQIVQRIKSDEGPILMIGDGMNDAPALAAATVGVSMGISGSAVAMETSHVTMMSNDIRKIPMVIKLARRTNFTIKINIILSVTTKLAVLGVAIAGHPLLWAAVLADVGTCLLVSLNSMLLLRGQSGKEKHCHNSAQATHNTRCEAAKDHCHSHGSCEADSHEKPPKASCCSSERTCCTESKDRGKKESHIERHDEGHCLPHENVRQEHELEEAAGCCAASTNDCCSNGHGSHRDDERKHRSHDSGTCKATEKRVISGCSKSYRDECRRDGCCGGGTARLPEIVIE